MEDEIILQHISTAHLLTSTINKSSNSEQIDICSTLLSDLQAYPQRPPLARVMTAFVVHVAVRDRRAHVVPRSAAVALAAAAGLSIQ